ncbi:hypothetical protein RhiJN_01546 [Ceratobasidium sp. AG-Ba]|nr:hypothetical protein RhiJN_01546 [Ceratobasidium sp. AG-Ba]
MGKKSALVAQSIPPEISNDPAVTVIVLDSEGSPSPAASPKDVPVANDSPPLTHVSPDANNANDLTGKTADLEKTQIETSNLNSSPEISSPHENEVDNTTRHAQERVPSSSTLSNWLTPTGQVDEDLVALAIHDLCDSKHCLWLGDPVKIARNTKWISMVRPNTSTLQWNNGAPDKPDDAEDEPLIGIIGKAADEGGTFNPDCGFQISWGVEGLSKQKRVVHVVFPGFQSGVSMSMWQNQLDGASQIIEKGHTLAHTSTGWISYSFFNSVMGTLRFRTPLFRKMPTVEECDLMGCLPIEPESNVPARYRMDTWNFGTKAVREAFKGLLDGGYEPQHLEAYNEKNKLIHPNDVPAILPGALVIVYFTLERALFNKGRGNPPEWQFYANLVKVQVLKQSRPTNTAVAAKRKLVHGYGPDSSGQDGPSSKQRKTVRAPVVVN